MSAHANPVWSTFDTFHGDVASLGARDAVARLFGALAHHRAETSLDEWRARCGDIATHPAMAQLLEDPCSRDARTKPAGYAGDARTLDYIYLQSPRTTLSDAGRAVFDVTTSVPLAAAVRNRSAVLGAYITERAWSGNVKVASVACGHARELDHVPSKFHSRLRYWGIDQDPDSVAHCQRSFGSDHFDISVASVRDVLIGRTRIPESNVIYASGLFDYLDQRAGALLVKRMCNAMSRHGVVLVPNLTPVNDEVGYMEAVLDWWMVYRTENDMRALADSAGLDPAEFRITTFTTAERRVAWLQVERA